MTANSVLIEGPRGFVVGAQAFLLDVEGREMAWAEQHVQQNSAYRWILGRYVQAQEPNQNGHIFDLDDLRAQQHTVVHAPLNMLHRPHYNVGAFVASELLYPTKGETAASPLQPEFESKVPFMEALAAFWHYYFRDEYEKTILPAYKEGRLFYSMEAVPPTITCPAHVGGCGQQFKYRGRQHDTYCDHLNKPLAMKVLNKPHFTAGALIVPPARPGWKSADITQLSELISANFDLAESAYTQAAEIAPHLSTDQWDSMMFDLMLAAGSPNDPHGYVPSVAGDKTSSCELCGQANDDVAHDVPDPKPAAHKATAAEFIDNLIERAKKYGLEREAIEAALENDEPILSIYGDYELDYEIARDFSKEKRDDLASKGLALPDGSFPIVTVADLKNAISAIGRAKDPGAAKTHTKKRAKALNRTDLIPTEWTGT